MNNLNFKQIEIYFQKILKESDEIYNVYSNTGQYVSKVVEIEQSYFNFFNDYMKLNKSEIRSLHIFLFKVNNMCGPILNRFQYIKKVIDGIWVGLKKFPG